MTARTLYNHICTAALCALGIGTIALCITVLVMRYGW
jgi:hypothetical protein